MVRTISSPQQLGGGFRVLERQLLTELVKGPSGPMLSQIVFGEGSLYSVSRAVKFIRQHYKEPFSVRSLVVVANMSEAPVSSLKVRYQDVSLMYQKQIRLQEARKLLCSGLSVSEAGIAVGYESASQFSR